MIIDDNHYDVIVIGSGAGGGTLAGALSRKGKSKHSKSVQMFEWLLMKPAAFDAQLLHTAIAKWDTDDIAEIICAKQSRHLKLVAQEYAQMYSVDVQLCLISICVLCSMFCVVAYTKPQKYTTDRSCKRLRSKRRNDRWARFSAKSSISTETMRRSLTRSD